MWEGYSLMYTVGNGYAHSQDLGDAGSCSKTFRYEFATVKSFTMSDLAIMGFSRKSQNSKNNFYILCAFCKILKSLLMVFPTAIASYF